jgi:hypothetical protein
MSKVEERLWAITRHSSRSAHYDVSPVLPIENELMTVQMDDNHEPRHTRTPLPLWNDFTTCIVYDKLRSPGLSERSKEGVSLIVTHIILARYPILSSHLLNG